jgi:hypothetical protein
VKCFFDTNALDWLVDDPDSEALADYVQRGTIVIITAADNVHEVQRIPEARRERRERLYALLGSHFMPIAPTHLPIAGIARAGAARIATSGVMALDHQLKGIGIDGLDANHLINAYKEQCRLFVTLDKGILKKSAELAELVQLECLEPSALLRRLRGV